MKKLVVQNFQPLVFILICLNNQTHIPLRQQFKSSSDYTILVNDRSNQVNVNFELT